LTPYFLHISGSPLRKSLGDMPMRFVRWGVSTPSGPACKQQSNHTYRRSYMPVALAHQPLIVCSQNMPSVFKDTSTHVPTQIILPHAKGLHTLSSLGALTPPPPSQPALIGLQLSPHR
jgi:hypothetical protein